MAVNCPSPVTLEQTLTAAFPGYTIRVEPLNPPMKYRIVAIRGEFARVLQFAQRFTDNEVATIATQDIRQNDDKWMRDNGHASIGADEAPRIWIPAVRGRAQAEAENSLSSVDTTEGEVK